MHALRAFIAGSFFPFIISSIVLWTAGSFSPKEANQFAAAHGVPYLWGLWNLLYFEGLHKLVPGSEKVKAWIYGAVLGLIVACLAVFWLGLPQQMGAEDEMVYAPFIVAPIVYAALWRYIVHPLNKLLNVSG